MGGYDLAASGMPEAILVSVYELSSMDDIRRFVRALRQAVQQGR